MAIHADGTIAAHHEGNLVGSSSEFVLSEADSWSFCFDEDLRIVPVQLVSASGEPVVWKPAEAQRRAKLLMDSVLKEP